jgi:hypothetical protein
MEGLPCVKGWQDVVLAVFAGLDCPFLFRHDLVSCVATDLTVGQAFGRGVGASQRCPIMKIISPQVQANLQRLPQAPELL